MRQLSKCIFYSSFLLLTHLAIGQTIFYQLSPKSTTDSIVLQELSYQKKFNTSVSLKLYSKKLQSKLYKSGYLDLYLSSPIPKNDTLYYSQLSFGQKYTFISLHIANKKIRNKLTERGLFEKKGNHILIPFSEIQKTLTWLTSYFDLKGQSFSSFQVVNIQKNKSHKITADLKSTFSAQRKIDSIIIKGYEKFPRSYTRYFLGLKKGDLFSKSTVENKLERLRNLPFASSMKPPQVQFTRKKTSIYLYLQKETSNKFNGFLGFSNSAENNKFQLQGNAHLLLRNNLNFGESLALTYQKNTIQTSFEARVAFPYVFNSPIGLELGLQLFKKDSSYLSVEKQMSLTYQITPKLKSYIGYGVTTSTNIEDTLSSQFSHIRDYTFQYTRLGARFTVFNKRNSITPIKTAIAFEIRYGTQKTTSQNTDQWSLQEDITHTFSLNKRNKIYLHHSASILFSNTYLMNEMFRFGGTNSIRGFAEHSLFANLYSATQTEYRFLLSNALYFHSILDHGYFENKINHQKEQLYSIGFGIGLASKAGLLRLSFATGKSEQQNLKFSNTRVHLSLTSHF